MTGTVPTVLSAVAAGISVASAVMSTRTARRSARLREALNRTAVRLRACEVTLMSLGYLIKYANESETNIDISIERVAAPTRVQVNKGMEAEWLRR